MKNLWVLWGAMTILMFAGCDKKNDGPQTGSLELTCKATFGAEDLVIGKAYAYPVNNSALKFYLVDYLMSNVRLINSDGDTVKLNDVDIVDFSTVNTDPIQAAAGITFRFNDIPAGEYGTLIVGIGVDTLVNRTKPQDYPSGHPLSIGANRYWDAWKSFIFTKTQGLADMAGNGVFNLPFAYHTGGDALYREVTFQKTTSIEGGKTATARMELDVRALLQQQDGTYWDIEAEPNAHTPGQPAMLLIMDNYPDALQLF
ncbi:MAG: hypothetical protein K9I85_09920 [Saprospiraceae bacterium]|nr:hypothetical protein [Saprospiraceae bacterium]